MGSDLARVTGPLADPGALVVAVRERLRDHVIDVGAEIFERARERWPIRTGKSREGLYLREESGGMLIFVRLGNSVPYARFVRSMKIGRRKGPDYRPAMTRELGDPVREAKRELPARAAAITADVVQEVLGG